MIYLRNLKIETHITASVQMNIIATDQLCQLIFVPTSNTPETVK